MDPDKKFSLTLAQSGKVVVSHQQLIRGSMSKVLIQCDFVSDSLLSVIARGDTQSERSPEPSWLDSQLRKKKEAADGGSGTSSSGKNGRRSSVKDKTLVMRMKSAEFKDNELRLTDGKLTLLGEDVVVRNGVTYFQGSSQLASATDSGPPVLSGSQVDKKRLKALTSQDGPRNLYLGNSELLDGQRPVIQNPQIQFGSQVYPLESVARRRSSAEAIDKELLQKILPNFEQLGAMAEEGSSHTPRTQGQSEDGGLNKVVLVNGRCVIKDDCVVILSGLLHVGCAWHRVNSSHLVGSKSSGNPRPVTITGTPVYKDASACAQLLLNNVTLYSRGSTVYAGNTPLLKDAVLHADGQVLSIADLHLRSICGMDPPEEPEPARLFVQGGKFTVDESQLNIMDGAVWFREAKVQLPDDSAEEVRVKDALIFLTPDSSKDGPSKGGASLYEGRDIIYKDNLLFLDDLTPLLKGGFICHEDQQQPLAWLSTDAEAMRRAQQSLQLRSSILDTPGDRVRMLTDGICIVDNHGMYFIEGSMILHGKEVMIDKGVPLFSSDFNEDDKKMHPGSLPPRLVGRVLLDPKGAKEMGAKTVKGFTILRNVRLDMTSGVITANKTVPVITDCRFILNKQGFSPAVLGVDAETPGAAPSHTESARVAAPQKAKRATSSDRAIKTDTPSDGQRASDLEDSGRGTSDAGADSGQRTTSDPEASQKASGELRKPDSSGPDSGQGTTSDPESSQKASAIDKQQKSGGGGPGSGTDGTTEAATPSTTDVTAGAHDSRQRDKPDSQVPRSGSTSAERARDQAPADAGGQQERDGSAGVGERDRPPGSDGTAGHDNRAGASPQDAAGGAPGGTKAVRSRADGGADSDDGTRVQRSVSPTSVTTAFGETSSAGILGKFSVSSRHRKQVVFSLRARIEDSLQFLDLDV